jgi:hypothetical protein
MALDIVQQNAKHKDGEKVITGCVKGMQKLENTQHVERNSRRNLLRAKAPLIANSVSHYRPYKQSNLELEGLVRLRSSILDVRKIKYTKDLSHNPSIDSVFVCRSPSVTINTQYPN